MIRRTLLAALLLVPVAVMAQRVPGVSGPQPELPKEKLVIVTSDGAKHPFNVEMAISEDQQETGLMFRPVVPADGDMLFINGDGTIRRIAENTTPRSLAVIPSGGAVRATLELAAGTAARLHLQV